jgi:glutamyl-tRNA reductase
MDITIIGTGRMAEGISTRLVSGGNNVTIIGRNKKEADELAGRLNSIAGKESKTNSYFFIRDFQKYRKF